MLVHRGTRIVFVKQFQREGSGPIVRARLGVRLRSSARVIIASDSVAENPSHVACRITTGDQRRISGGAKSRSWPLLRSAALRL
jgi:hypothetical protein